ncbi:hypothetical protein AAF712_010546 [Marasmius tenuissimus]|uniref:Nucleotidyltransferase family protein n=1 Tax=Marasmius tenuissimus TaxID=585030 RepID=A0ABR2ZLR8_9AGAR
MPSPQLPRNITSVPVRTYHSLNYRQIWEVISAASSAAEKAGYGCYLFGSAAIHLLCPGARAPGDIDLVVYPLARTPTGRPTPTLDAERVKVEIQRHDPRFYRVKAKDPSAKYAPFWFSYESDYPDCTQSIKVDIIPVDSEDLKIPTVPLNRLIRGTHTINGAETLTLHVMPFFALLLMKLNGWHDNHISPKPWLRRKTATDIIDVKALLNIVAKKNETLTAPRHQWFPAWFVARGRGHAGSSWQRIQISVISQRNSIVGFTSD